MNWLFDLPLEARLGIVFALGLVIGTQVNRGIYRLAWKPRKIGPWSPRDRDAPPRQWYDYLPVFGWITLRRESKLHGSGYWHRPMMIELALAGGLALLYWWEVENGLIPQRLVTPPRGNPFPATPLPDLWIHAQFAVHVVLIALMTTASFIDVDEKIIPDGITVLGALLGLALAAALPYSRLPDWEFLLGNDLLPVPQPTPWESQPQDHLLFIASPDAPPAWSAGSTGLILGIACYLGWWLAIIPSIWTTRFGFVKAVRYKLAGMARAVLPRKGHPYYGWSYLPILMGGLTVIVGVWLARDSIGAWHWHSLLSALVGMAAGGAIVWGVRIAGTSALKQEAMGFGDVTLVAMIGAYLGWQPCLMLFFIAPFIGVIVAVMNWIITREIDIWYGPFLCLGALAVVVFWATLWGRYASLFEMPLPLFNDALPLVPSLTVFMFALIWAMLILWRFVKEKFIFRGEEE